MGQRFTQGRIPQKSRASLWGATYILLGLRYSAALAQQLLTGVVSMKESTTYQAILQEGRAVGLAEGRAEGQVQEARAILVALGSELFGSPDAATQAALEAITEEPRLRALIFGLRTAKSWENLLQTPGSPPSRRKRGRRPS
jgi:predicted transposase YdaD